MPGRAQRPIDCVVDADLEALTQIWMGDVAFADALRDARIVLEGRRALNRRFPDRFGRHPVLAEHGPAA